MRDVFPLTSLAGEMRITSHFCLHVRRDSDEYKRWKASQGGEVSVEEAAAALTLKDKDGNEIEKQLPGGKKKVKTKPQVRQLAAC